MAIFLLMPDQPIITAFFEDKLLVLIQYRLRINGKSNYTPLESYVGIDDEGFKVRNRLKQLN